MIITYKVYTSIDVKTIIRPTRDVFQTGYLDVRIPPNILDETDIEGPGSAAMEGGTIRLRCRSTGKPEPKVHWKRKDNRHIIIRSDGAREKQGL